MSEEVGGQLFKLVGHPSGDLAMMGFRVLMYSGGLVGACVYLAKLKEVREPDRHRPISLEDELMEGDLGEESACED